MVKPNKYVNKICKIELIKLLREKVIRESRHNLWTFCKTLQPDFYSNTRPHLKLLCDTLQNFSENKLLKPDGTPYRKLMLNVPPRFGKTRTLVLFSEWVLGRNQEERIIATSYSDDAAYDFSRYTRNGIDADKNMPDDIVFSDIFPACKIQRGNASYEKWALEGQYFNYKGAGLGGAITGKGGTIIIQDDLVKDASTAYNERALDSIWAWRTGTLLSRGEKGDTPFLEILNMTRWAKKDPCGRILNNRELAKDWYVLKLEVLNEETGELLCPELYNMDDYLRDKTQIDPAIFRANYHQDPVDIKGTLYKDLKTYTETPEFNQIINYTDTADEGKDYLVSITAGEKDGEAWLLDVYMTKDGMEVTEPGIAQFFMNENISVAKIESNNGGRGFARAIKKIISENVQGESTLPEEAERKWRLVPINWFHQTDNKQARILSNSNYIMQHVYFPFNWRDRFPEFYQSITEYQKEGTNQHDDAPDALTGIVEMISKSRPKARLIT